MSSGEYSEWVSKFRFWINEILSEVTQRDWRLPPRTWQEFFERFSFPKSKSIKSLANRVYLNLNYYQSNYLVIIALALILFLLRKPWSVLEVSVLVVGWTIATQTSPIIINGRRLTRRERFGIMTLLSILLPLLTGILRQLLWTFFYTFCVILIHAAFRTSTIRHQPGELHAQLNNKW